MKIVPIKLIFLMLSNLFDSKEDFQIIYLYFTKILNIYPSINSNIVVYSSFLMFYIFCLLY